MSQPKRLSAFLTEHPQGTYCYYSDYAAIAAENERLRNVIGADAIDREHGMCCDASSQVERLREAAQAVELAFQTLENGLIETPHWVRQQAMRDAVSQLRAAAKEGRDAK